MEFIITAKRCVIAGTTVGCSRELFRYHLQGNYFLTFPLNKVFDSVKILYNFCNILCGYALYNIHQSEIKISGNFVNQLYFFQKMGQSHHQRQWKEKQRNFNLNEYQKKEREGVQVHK